MTYDPPKPTFAEYLAKCELAADVRAVLIKHHDYWCDPAFALGWASVRREPVQPRDKRTLPLP